MTPSELNGYKTGLKDIADSRWDDQDVIPPAKFAYHDDWYVGYRWAYVERVLARTPDKNPSDPNCFATSFNNIHRATYPRLYYNVDGSRKDMVLCADLIIAKMP